MHALPFLICNNNVVDKSIQDITTIGDLKCSLLTRFLAVSFQFHTVSELGMEADPAPSCCRAEPRWCNWEQDLALSSQAPCEEGEGREPLPRFAGSVII